MDDENLSFLIEHGGRRFLVHPSAGRRFYGTISPVPDVVFLGMGRVGRMAEGEAREYLEGLTRESATGPDPAVVVPIHWDDLSTAPGNPLRPPPIPFDNVPRGFERLCLIAQDRPNTAIIKLDEGAVLTWIDREQHEVAGPNEYLCRSASPP